MPKLILNINPVEPSQAICTKVEKILYNLSNLEGQSFELIANDNCYFHEFDQVRKKFWLLI